MNAPPLSSKPARDELKVSFRPASREDQKFLQALYASTRQEEMSLVNWPAAQKEAFLLMQFNARQRFYESSYPGAVYFFLLSLAGGFLLAAAIPSGDARVSMEEMTTSEVRDAIRSGKTTALIFNA